MNLKSFDLNLLRVLDALLHEKSTTLAGQRIGLSQPAVSAALGRLRAALGDPLFVRQGQRLESTDYARSLELPLRAAMDELESLLSGPPDFDPATAEATFQLSGSDFFAEMLMPRLADRLERLAPGVLVQMVDLVPDNYIAGLYEHAVDIALVPFFELPEWADFQPLFNSSFAFIARKGHPALADVPPGEPVPLDTFCALGHVLFSPEGKRTAMGDVALAKTGRTRRVVMTMSVFSGVCRAVAGSDRVALIPRQLALAVAQRTRLEVYQPPIPMELPLIVQVWHRRMTNAPAHRWLRGQIAELLAPLNAGEPEIGDIPGAVS